MMKYIMFLMFVNSLFFNKLLLLNFVLFLSVFDNNYLYLSKLFFLDELSYYLILLLGWIFSLVYLICSDYKFYMNYFLWLMKLLNMFMLMVFSFIDFFNFYLFFEISMLLMFMVVIGFGYQYERMSSSIYMMFYTFFPSLMLLLGIYYYYGMVKDLNMMFWLKESYSLFFYFCMVIMFLIKLPIYFFHFWLPKAHVEASLEGSMILASIFLKLGAYGIYRVFFLLEKFIVNYKNYIMMFFMLSSIIMSGICCLQVDLKMLVAYSSIVHMSFMMMGLVSLIKTGLMSYVIIMISHGFCSSGLFVLVNLVYQRFGSRSMIMFKGVINYLPMLTLLWFMLSTSNFSCPPSLNFMGEIHILIVSLKVSVKYLLLIMIYIFINAFYSLFMFVFTQYGKMDMFTKFDLFNQEILVLLMHWMPLNMVFFMKYF
uniref:NADH-ubiquinone oxidoreductase chain 4 n=1 Tax=Xenos yangi TaxID=2980483 RepID=A0A977LKX7_9NEOP|nr:NADH dehydrogenase subunit 4 [Xenos yangi]